MQEQGWDVRVCVCVCAKRQCRDDPELDRLSPLRRALPTHMKLSRVFCTFFTRTSSQTCPDWLGSVPSWAAWGRHKNSSPGFVGFYGKEHANQHGLAPVGSWSDLGFPCAIPRRYALVLGPWFRSASLRSGAVLAPLVGWFGCASRLAGGGLVRSASVPVFGWAWLVGSGGRPVIQYASI